MTYTQIQSRSSILSAIEEYDQLGALEFLARYGYSPAKKYFLVYNGKEYPSKAILGVAH